MKEARVLIAGAGALGSIFGGFLRHAGYPVTLLGRKNHLDVIERDGLRIEGLWGEHHVTGFHFARAPEEIEGRFDLVLLPVKSFDTATMAAAIAPFVADDGVVLSLQNGLGNVERIEAVVGLERTLGARVIFGALLPAPGRARVTVFADPTAIGALRPGLHAARDARAKEWAGVIDAAGVPTVYTEELEALLWAKVFYNAALNPLGALLRLHYGALAEREHGRAIMDSVIEEAFAVARAEGVALRWPDAAAYRKEFYGRLVPATFHHRSSMLQDLERGRPTEVDSINGEVWRRARARGIVATVNETLARLIHLVEPPASSETGDRSS